MRSLWFFRKGLILIPVLLLASSFWHTEGQAQSASLRLTWTDTSDNEDGFKIERLVAGLVDTTLTVPTSATSYADSALVSGTVYCYRVQAFNSAGNSDPSNQACAMAEGSTASVSASPTTIPTGGTITASWSGIGAPTPTDWIGLYTPGAADTNPISWIFVSCSKVAGSARASGSCPYGLPTTVSPGNYELRLFANDTYMRLATTTVTIGTPPTLTVSPTTVKAGATVTATWNGITAPTSMDWLGLYASGAADTNPISWIFVSCSKVAGGARASGSCPYGLPTTVSPGNYELRLFANDTYMRLATTTVTIGTPPTLTVSPTTVKAGATVTATWNGITAPTSMDWLGLYASGAADTNPISWIFVSCSKVAGGARASGSCPYGLPTTVSPGNYELRLFANDTYTRLITGNTFTVSTSSNSTPIVLTNAISTGTPSSAYLLPQVSRVWSDYDLKVNLRSMNNQSIGVMFRYKDDRNYYRLVWNQKLKFRRLEKIENGRSTVLASDTVGYVKGRTYRARIIAQGATLRAFIDGAQIFSVVDSSFAEGTVGLYVSKNQASFDNIVVQDLTTSAVLLSEDFGDDSFSHWTIVDQGRNQGPSVWSATSGTLLQTSNIDGTFALYTARDWADYRVTAKLRSMDKGSMGVMFRYQGSNDYYRFAWDARDGLRRLEKVQSGALTVLATDAVSYVTGEIYNVAITAKGTSLEVQINGKIVFSVTDSSLPKGSVALYSSYNPGSSFDDVLVEDFTTGAVLLSDDFNDGAFTGWTIVDKGTDQGPSLWSATSGSLVQSSNIGSVNSFDGTFALY